MKRRGIIAIVVLTLMVVIGPAVLTVHATQATNIFIELPPLVLNHGWFNTSVCLADQNGDAVGGVWVYWYMNGHRVGSAVSSSDGCISMPFHNISCPFDGVDCNPPISPTSEGFVLVGIYNITAVFNGTATHAPAQGHSVMTIVDPPSASSSATTKGTRFILQVHPTIFVGDWVNITGTLTDDAGNPVGGGWVTLFMNGSETGGVRNDIPGGNFGWGFSGGNFVVGTYTFTAVFNGTSSYAPSQGQAVMAVFPARTTTTLALQVPTASFVGDWVNMSAWMTNASGYPVVGMWVTLYVNGHELGGAIDSPTGYYRWSTNTFSSAGPYTISVVFNGTSTYAPAQAQAVMKVFGTLTTVQSSQTTTSILPVVSTSNQASQMRSESEPITGLSDDALALSTAIVVAGICIGLGAFFGIKTKK